jgi:hypothetical protein
MPFFENTRPGRNVTHGQATFDLPILYFRDDFFGLYFTADYAKVKASMPSDNLVPLMLPNGKAIVAVAAFNYIDTTIGPYGEVPVVIPVVYKGKGTRMASLLPLLMEGWYPRFGLLVQHLPVTKVVARDAGRGEWGYTKFVADMIFTVTPEYFQCALSEKNTPILDLRVRKRGFRATDRKPMITYSVKQGRLIKTKIPVFGLKRVSFLPWGSHVTWGNHPMADSVRALGLSAKPFMSMYYSERSAILPSGEVLESNVRPYEGYVGEPRVGIHQTFYTESR